MGVYLEIVFTVLGGLIAGIVGISSTYISLRAHRREKNLDEHKENLKLLRSALQSGKGQLWPFTNGAEDLNLAKSYLINDILGTGIGIITSQLILDHSDNTLHSVDPILYEDIENHFKSLWSRLENTNSDIEENAKVIYENINKLSKSIYGILNRDDTNIGSISPIRPPRTANGDYEKSQKLKFKDSEGDVQEKVAGIVFLFAIQEDEKNWPNRITSLKAINLYAIFKKIGDTVNNEMKPEINKMLELHNKLFSDIDNCLEEIEIILHQTKLKGRCKLA